MLRLHSNACEWLRCTTVVLISATFGLTAPSAESERVIVTTVAAHERIAINDNRAAAGTLAGGTLTIRLEARVGEWHPDKDGDPGISVKAFAVEGRPLQIPGPLIRVPEGTEIRAWVRNSLNGSPLAIHGLHSRAGNGSVPATAVSIPPGETREFKFLAGTPGTYYYWGATAAETLLPQRAGSDRSAAVGSPPACQKPRDRNDGRSRDGHHRNGREC
jgi:FtsP/CotA-like multicopper oxidase with cupredoxin domain